MTPDFKKINLAEYIAPKKRPKFRFSKKIKAIFIVIFLLIFSLFVFSSGNSDPSSFNYNFPRVFSGDQIKSTDGRVNVLLLGNAGGKHDGPSLTDSIIVASYHLKTHQVMLISIPRDLWVDSTRTKINAVYEIGERPNNGGDGLAFAKDKIDDLLGIPIHYGVRIDFAGFAKAIDQVGGVDVEVPKTFDDYNYPITGKEDDLCGLTEKEIDLSEEDAKKYNLPKGKQKVFVDSADKIATDEASFGCRYEHIHYDKGRAHLTGEDALKFVRSRHGTNGEGSDFARSKRQQLVIQSFRDKALSVQTLFNLPKVTGLISTFGRSFETDIPNDKLLDFYNLAKKVESTQSLVLGDLGSGKSILTIPPPSEYGGAFVLAPPGGDFEIIKQFLKNELDKQATASTTVKK